MKRVRLISLMLLVAVLSSPVAAQSPIIVRDSLGAGALQTTCFLLGCSVNEQIDGSLGNVFLITSPPGVPLQTFLQNLVG